MTQRFWDPAALARRSDALRCRSAVLRAVREVFDEQGFTEVETPALQISPGMEPHLAVFETRLLEPGHHADGSGKPRYLHTSPEFAMKKLLAGGKDIPEFQRIWQIAPVFRNAEGSPTHHPEFRMIEWYRANADYRDLIPDCRELLHAVAIAVGTSRFIHKGAECNPFADWDVVTIEEAFHRWADIDLMGTIEGDLNDPEPGLLADAARAIGIRTAEGDRWDDIFFRIFDEKIEPNLGHPAPTVLIDYPVNMAALSRPKPGDPRLAERFELYVAGLELANAFGELTDADAQRERFNSDMDLKERLYGKRLPIDEGFLDAVANLPPCAGIALGFDRLAMLAAHTDEIQDVLWAWVE